MSNKAVLSKKHKSLWEGHFQVGCYWFPVMRRGRVATFKTAEAARAAASKANPFRKAA